MMNPQSPFRSIDVSTMYRYSQRTNIPWAIKEYHTPRLEVNANLQIQKRKWQAQKKGEKDGRYVTKRGFYMDYDLKVAKSIPSTHVHGEQKSWDFEKIKKSGSHLKVDRKLSKNTYLDFIQITQKNRKSPGIATYNLQKSLKEKEQQGNKSSKKNLNVGQRIFFYQNTHALSNIVPGAGNYSPHSISSTSSPDRKDYKFWVKKHKEENEKLLKRESIKPAPGTHSPLNTTLKTFEQLSTELSKPTKRKYFGSDAKFEYTRPTKKKIFEKRPDPSVHSTIVEWKGKDVSPNKSTLYQSIWTGRSQSIYR